MAKSLRLTPKQYKIYEEWYNSGQASIPKDVWDALSYAHYYWAASKLNTNDYGELKPLIEELTLCFLSTYCLEDLRETSHCMSLSIGNVLLMSS